MSDTSKIIELKEIPSNNSIPEDETSDEESPIKQVHNNSGTSRYQLFDMFNCIQEHCKYRSIPLFNHSQSINIFLDFFDAA